MSTTAPKTRSTSVSRSEANFQNVKNDIKPEKNTKVSKKEEKSQNDHSKRKRSESTKNEPKKESMKKPKPLKGVTGNAAIFLSTLKVFRFEKSGQYMLFEYHRPSPGIIEVFSRCLVRSGVGDKLPTKRNNWHKK